jgi:hypothetical protein
MCLGLFRGSGFVFVLFLVLGSDTFSRCFGLGEFGGRAADVALLAWRQVVDPDEFVVVFDCIDVVSTLACDSDTGDRKCSGQSIYGGNMSEAAVRLRRIIG